MSFDTIEHNRRRYCFDGVESVWLFGYGSLIYKVDFPFLEQRPATIEGWLADSGRGPTITEVRLMRLAAWSP